jgi:hypothetical protein
MRGYPWIGLPSRGIHVIGQIERDVRGVLVNFLRTMNDLPIAAWCDLDARGIEIVTELAGRLGREITPVGMGTELFVGGKQYVPGRHHEERAGVAGVLAVSVLALA